MPVTFFHTQSQGEVGLLYTKEELYLKPLATLYIFCSVTSDTRDEADFIARVRTAKAVYLTLFSRK